MEWIMENLATVVVGCFLLAAVILAVRSLIKTYKNGGCGCGCAGCSRSKRHTRKK